jgi:hypothetical protein
LIFLCGLSHRVLGGSGSNIALDIAYIIACRAVSRNPLRTSSRGNSQSATIEELLEKVFSTVVRAEGL